MLVGNRMTKEPLTLRQTCYLGRRKRKCAGASSPLRGGFNVLAPPGRKLIFSLRNFKVRSAGVF
jgi:hypothetical protein